MSELTSAEAFSSDEEHKTAEKALRLNLDNYAYGTFAEIGGGQEVARWFFRVGGAAGTVAKTMSAYDMLFSDAIYGKGTRYVSQQRLVAMLDHEYRLLEERLKESRGGRTRFFVFANTISARNYAGTNECHGWLGLRFQAEPLGPSNEILVHVNLRDNTNLLQQQALGTLGVNLIHGALYQRDSLDEMLKGFFESLDLSRIEIDFVKLSGPEFEGVEPTQVSLTLLRNQLCRGVAFDQEGGCITPSELLHNRSIVLQRGAFAQSSEKFSEMMITSVNRLGAELKKPEKAPLGIFELSINSVRPYDTPGDQELLHRIQYLNGIGYPVFVSNFIENFRLSHYLRRYTQEPIRFVVGIGTLVQLMRESFYTEVEGGLLEGLGKLLSTGVKVYAFPMACDEFGRKMQAYQADKEFCVVPKEGMVTAKNVSLHGAVRHLYAYLLESGSIVPVD